MITMPHAWREQVPMANFFHRGGYRDSPVAQRNNVVAKLIAATDTHMNLESKKAGAQELAAASRRTQRRIVRLTPDQAAP